METIVSVEGMKVPVRWVPIIGRASAMMIRPIAARRSMRGRLAKRSRIVRLTGVCAAEEIVKRSPLARARHDQRR